MSGIAGPDIIKDSLVLSLDAANWKSFRGEPTSNVLNSIAESYPTASNTWGTFEVYTSDGHNLYNSGSPFTLTIDGVSGNEVTVTNHPFWTYDVVQPQSTGGGLTSGTYYFVKKTGTNTFTLHAYDNTENGSKGYDAYGFAVHNSVNTDTRVSINATSFPTSWWGPPHAPNSQCVKQIIPNGFFLEGRRHDCWRIHWFRIDNVVDSGGPAYGYLPFVSVSTTYTVSFYHRAASSSAIGQSISFQIYCTDSDNAYANPYSPVVQYWEPASTSEWTRFSHTWTQSGTQSGACYFYWLTSNGNAMAVDIAEIQLEAKDHVTQFTPTTRGDDLASDGGWLDLSGNSNNATVYGPIALSMDAVPCFDFASVAGSYSSDASMGFLFDSNMITRTGNFTFNCWVKNPNATSGQIGLFSNAGSGDGYRFGVGQDSIYYLVGPPYAEGSIYFSDSYDNNKWNNITAVFDRLGTLNGGTPRMQMYMNGVFQNNSIILADQVEATNTAPGIVRSPCCGKFTGKLAMFQAYNKALTASEVLRNYNALKGRFGR